MPAWLSSALASPLFVLPLCYLLGALPFSFLVVRATRGIDLRRRGSGNLGAANTARVAGLLPALAVFGGDFGKGALGMTLAVRTFGHGPTALAALAMIVLGHNYSIFVRLSGGKGLAAAAGGLFVFAPWLLLAAGTLGLAVLAVTTDFYLAAMAMAAALPGLVALFAPGRWQVLIAVAVGLVILARHRGNLSELRGKQRRAGVGDGLFGLLAGLTAFAFVAARLILSSSLTCFQLPLFVVAGRWAGTGLAILAVWAASSRAGRRAVAFIAGAATVIALTLTIIFVYAAVRTGGIALPSLMTQIGDGSWHLSQASVAAVAAHHLYWVIGLMVAEIVSRAPETRR